VGETLVDYLTKEVRSYYCWYQWGEWSRYKIQCPNF
jgi:hypothetical protein